MFQKKHAFMDKIPRIALDFTNRSTRGVVSNIFVGAGLAYAMERKAYRELPLPILFPSAYAGYHLWKYRQKWLNIQD